MSLSIDHHRRIILCSPRIRLGRRRSGLLPTLFCELPHSLAGRLAGLGQVFVSSYLPTYPILPLPCPVLHNSTVHLPYPIVHGLLWLPRPAGVLERVGVVVSLFLSTCLGSCLYRTVSSVVSFVGIVSLSVLNGRHAHRTTLGKSLKIQKSPVVAIPYISCLSRVCLVAPHRC